MTDWSLVRTREDAIKFHLTYTPKLGIDLIKVIVDAYDAELAL